MRGPRLDRYEVVQEIGRGGMSVVYRARDVQLGRDVALKVLHQFLADDPQARRRLGREALAVARLRHPSILEIYDSSEPGAEHAWLVTELIEGPTLRAWLDRNGAPSLPEAAALIGLEVVRALRHAHEQGVLHRDLKPENVMITPSGAIKLMDFGIAQIIGGATRLTLTGTLLGSPAHMAPEIIDGDAPDHRADLFSVGTILYWLVTGALPFEAPTPSALFRRILEGDYEPPQLVAPKLGNGLARIIERALQPDLTARYQDVSEIEADLVAELDAVGWYPSEPFLREVLLDPEAFVRARSAGLVDRLVDEGRLALEAGDLPRALDRLNRAAAHRPDDAPVRALLERAARPPRRPPRWAWASLGAVGMAGLVAFAVTFDRAPHGSRPEAALAAPQAEESSTGGGPPDAAPDPRPDGPSTTERAASFGRGEATDPSVEADLPRVGGPRSSGVSVAVRGLASPRGETSESVARRPLRTAPMAARAAGAQLGVPHDAGTAQAASTEELAAASAEREQAARAAARAEGRTLLRVRIGRSFATIRLDGRTRLQDSYHGDLELSPGLHVVEVVKPGVGRFEPRRVEATEAGTLIEHLPDGGRRPLVEGVLDFRVPTTPDEASSTAGWIPG